MKKILIMLFAGFICIYLVGCSGWLVRTSSSRQERVDQKVSGNRGFIFGQPTAPPKEPTFKDRKVFRFEIEMPSLRQKEKTESEVKKEEVYPGLFRDFFLPARYLLIAAAVESRGRIFSSASNDGGMLTTGTTDIAGTFASNSYDRSAAMYHQDADGSVTDDWIDAAWMGDMLATKPGSATWMFISR